MTRRRRRRLAVGAVLLAVVVAVVAGGRLAADGTAPQARSEGEFPTALAGHLAKLSQTTPGNQGMANEGPASAAEAAFLQRAYPAETISLAQAAGAQSAFAAAKGRPFPSGKGVKGSWVSVGPSQALYPKTPFRNSFSYVPAEYVAGGRTTAIAIAPSCKPGDCTAVHHARRRRDLAHEERADRPAELGVPRRPARDQRGGRGHDRPERRVGQHDLRRHRRGQHLRLRLRGGRRHLQVDRRRLDVDRPARRQTPSPLPARASARSSSSPAPRTRSTPGRRRRSAACRRVVLRGRHSAGPGRREVGPLQVDRTAARRGRSSTTAP